MKLFFWIFILIFVFLLVVYNTGAVNVLGVLGNFLDTTILFLQGRDKNGNLTNYPQ